MACNEKINTKRNKKKTKSHILIYLSTVKVKLNDCNTILYYFNEDGSKFLERKFLTSWCGR